MSEKYISRVRIWAEQRNTVPAGNEAILLAGI